MSIQIQARTMQIQGEGTGRLSPDLAAMGKAFRWNVDRKSKVLKLTPVDEKEASEADAFGTTVLVAWGTPRSKSKSIALRSVLKALNIEPEKVSGKVYDVRIRGKTLEVQL
jgi:hypothetical protein